MRTAVGARKAIVAYHPERIRPDAIRETIRGLGMTVADAPGPGAGPRRSLPELLGWGFVSVVALVALVGIAGERLGLAEALVERIPPWLALAAVLAGGYPIFRNVARALRNRSVTPHALMTLGIVGALAIGQYAAAAVIVFFMRLADFIEGYTTERSRQAIRELLRLAPETARVERGGGEIEVPAGEVARGEVVLVKPGERIPVDGAVVEGRASVNQASITGESVPVEKVAGDHVFAATICDRGALRIRTERVGPETTFGQILRLVEQAEAAKAPVQRFADRFTAYYIPVVLAVAVATLLIGGSVTAAVATVLVACSCAIAMATPVTVLAAVGQAAKQGIVIKGGRYLEALAKVDTLVMDKTGTLTIGRPDVTDVVPLDDATEDVVLAAAGSVERRSEHPLAEGIVRAAERRRLALGEPRDFDVVTGEGVAATVAGERVLCGTEKFMRRHALPVAETIGARIEALAAEGKSVVLVARGERLIGIIALADTLRPEVPEALVALRRLGIRRQILLTGDRRQVAAALAGRLGLEFEAEVLPDQKIRVDRTAAARGPGRGHGRRRDQRRPGAGAGGRRDRDGRRRDGRGHRGRAHRPHAGRLAGPARDGPDRPPGVPDDPAEPLVHGRLQRGRDGAGGDGLAAADRRSGRAVAPGRRGDAELRATAAPPVNRAAPGERVPHQGRGAPPGGVWSARRSRKVQAPRTGADSALALEGQEGRHEKVSRGSARGCCRASLHRGLRPGAGHSGTTYPSAGADGARNDGARDDVPVRRHDDAGGHPGSPDDCGRGQASRAAVRRQLPQGVHSRQGPPLHGDGHDDVFGGTQESSGREQDAPRQPLGRRHAVRRPLAAVRLRVTTPNPRRRSPRALS